MSVTGGANEDRPRSTIDERALAHQAYEAWEKKAALWDKMMRLSGLQNRFYTHRAQVTGALEADWGRTSCYPSLGWFLSAAPKGRSCGGKKRRLLS
jgi:hypothetical protein